MRYKVSEKTKKIQSRGNGEGTSYKPYIKTREVPSTGTGRILKDKKNGRQMHLLSQGEVYAYYLLRWDDTVVDIREQYPLELEDTLKIADHLGYKHPKDRKTRMTTDLLVTYQEDDGTKTYKAYSIKDDRKVLVPEDGDTPAVLSRKNRNVEIQRIEMAYWNLHGIPFELVFKEDFNRIKVGNIEAVMDYWDIKSVRTKMDFVKHLIATKKIVVDMDTEPLNFSVLAEQYVDNKLYLSINDNT